MSDHLQITRYLNEQLPCSLALLERMVAINSFTSNRAGVDQLGALTAESFGQLGFTAEFIPSIEPKFGHHLLLTRRGTSERSIGLISHLDTVFPPEEELQNEFRWRKEGDRIYGPGTMDIKGGTVMIHMMLRAIREFFPKEFEETTWLVLLDASEETLSHDFGALCVERLKDHGLAALVFEAGGRADHNSLIVTARKGRATFRVTVEGRGAHAGGQHQRGANAIVQIADTIQRIAELTDYSKELTFNVGTVSGGTVVNRVPHLASAEIEMRAFSSEAYQAGLNAVQALGGPGTIRSAEDGHPTRVSVRVISESPPWPKNEATERLFEIWQKRGKQIGIQVLREHRGGLSDANFIWRAVPTLDGLGPHGDNCHCSERSSDGSKDQEYADATSFVPKATLNILAILDLLALSK